MTESGVIFVRLLDEGVEVWRPVEAQRVGEDAYRIMDQPYDREIETWQFEPGDYVVVELIESNDGPMLTAARRR